ncbi:hypothetical protein AVEN_13579-1 [Araneus ventricosus]|uniref:Uncharacterized protein n=1 Tax=Araneus ventricosus TaxID=182803 RepID=A0A4Y2D3P5_ARAVE|nr:hypothetical protein AVEN_13579-1 [Araneus ventricosus]
MAVDPLNHLSLPSSRRTGERPQKLPLPKETFRFNITVNMTNMMSITLRTLLCIALICCALPHQIEGTSIGDALQTVTGATAEPTTDPFRFLLLCAPGSERRNTCEKCTKVTRDPNTYKMCCENTSGVRRWCRTFLDYTLPPRVIGIY